MSADPFRDHPDLAALDVRDNGVFGETADRAEVLRDRAARHGYNPNGEIADLVRRYDHRSLHKNRRVREQRHGGRDGA